MGFPRPTRFMRFLPHVEQQGGIPTRSKSEHGHSARPHAGSWAPGVERDDAGKEPISAAACRNRPRLLPDPAAKLTRIQVLVGITQRVENIRGEEQRHPPSDIEMISR